MPRRDAPDSASRRSAALAYSGEGAPVLVAKGSGETAAQILERAREHDIPVVEDSELAAVLGSLPLGDEIPPELYVAVAEVLAYVYRLADSIDDRV
jgi:flagellar biosynthesis protein